MDSSKNLLLNLNRNHIKYLVIILMVFDHINHIHHFSPEAVSLAVRFFSRLTATSIFYFIAEGYEYTHNLKKYVLRLAVFGVISHFAYNYFVTGSFFQFYESSTITTLFLGLLAIIVADAKKLPIPARVLIILCIWIASFFCDWKIYGVLFCLVFHFFKANKKIMWTLYLIVCCMYVFNINPLGIFMQGMNVKFQLYRTGTLLFIPFKEFCFNGKAGSKTRFHKYFFYIFYPAHLIIIRVIYQYLGLA